MPNEDPLLEIPDQPRPIVPARELESSNPPPLTVELDTYKKQRYELDLHVEKTMLRQRKIYAAMLFFLSLAWLSYIGRVLWLAGLAYLKLADSVLIALITTTTANVLGLFYIVARWLFPNKNSDDSNKP